MRRTNAATRIGCWLSIISLILGCGGAARAIVKSQINTQCASVGLKGCPAIAEGALQYMDGYKTAAEAQLRVASAANSPEQLEKFAKVIDPIISATDDDTARSLRAIIAILTGDQSHTLDAREDRRSAIEKISPVTTKGPDSPQPEHLIAGMVTPVIDEAGASCEGRLLPFDPRKCRRTLVLGGTIVITNLYASGGCPDDLFVMATSGSMQPVWTILVLAGNQLNISGRLPIQSSELLLIGTRASAFAGKDDGHCTITWSGYRPNALPPANPYGHLN